MPNKSSSNRPGIQLAAKLAAAEARQYSPGFKDWPLEKRNEYFAEEARRYREAPKRAGAKASLSGERGLFVTAETRARDATPETILVRLDEIEPEPVSWVWKYFIALGKLHIIAGAPGDGKPTILLYSPIRRFHPAACSLTGQGCRSAIASFGRTRTASQIPSSRASSAWART